MLLQWLFCQLMMSFPLQELQKVSGGRKGDQGGSQKTSLESNQPSVPLFLQYPVPYTQDTPTPLLVAQSPSKLQFGNPYSVSDPKGQSYSRKTSAYIRSTILTASSQNHPPPDDDDEEFSDNQLLRLPPVGPPSWDSNVVCIQPTRNPSRPEGHEEPEEKQNNNNNNVRLPGWRQASCCEAFLHAVLHFYHRIIPTKSPQQQRAAAPLSTTVRPPSALIPGNGEPH